MWPVVAAALVCFFSGSGQEPGMGSREVGALETMEQVLISLRRLRDEAGDAIRGLV